MACYKITSVTNTGSALNLALPQPSMIIKNGERACFVVCPCLPASTTVVPVNFTIGSTTVPLYDMLGNQLYSDQLSTQVRIPGVWGTNPLHFKLCSCVKGRSQGTPCTATIPVSSTPAKATEEVDG